MRFTLLSILLVFSLPLLAQINYNPNLFVGGSLTFSTNSSSNHIANLKTKFNSKRISFKPILGTALTDKWDLGIRFTFLKSKSFFSNSSAPVPISSSKNTIKSFDFSIFSRYHFYKKDVWSVFLQPSFSLGNSISINNATVQHTFKSSIGISLGSALKIQKHFKLLFHFGEINYYFIGVRPENGLEKKSSKFLSKIQFSDLGLGVEYVF